MLNDARRNHIQDISILDTTKYHKMIVDEKLEFADMAQLGNNGMIEKIVISKKTLTVGDLLEYIIELENKIANKMPKFIQEYPIDYKEEHSKIKEEANHYQSATEAIKALVNAQAEEYIKTGSLELNKDKLKKILKGEPQASFGKTEQAEYKKSIVKEMEKMLKEGVNKPKNTPANKEAEVVKAPPKPKNNFDMLDID